MGTLRSTLDAMNADEKLKAPPNSIVLGPTPYVSPGREGKRSPRSVSPLHAKYLSSSTALAAASAIAVPSSSALAVRLQRAPSVDKDMHHSQLMYEGLEVQAERVPGTMVISLARDQEPLSRDFGGALLQATPCMHTTTSYSLACHNSIVIQAPSRRLCIAAFAILVDWLPLL